MLAAVILVLAVFLLLAVVSVPVRLYLKNPEKYRDRGWFFNLMANTGEVFIFRK